MPIYEYYCPDNHTIYQFFAKTLAHGRTIPPCPDNPRYRMQKAVSAFAVTGGGKDDPGAAGPTAAADAPAGGAEDARMEAALGAMEREFSSIDENDPRAMGRMMRRMAELTGEKIDGEMEAVVRKLEEGVDPESLEEELGAGSESPPDEYADAPEAASAPEAGDGARKSKRVRRSAARQPLRRDPALYDYP